MLEPPLFTKWLNTATREWEETAVNTHQAHGAEQEAGCERQIAELIRLGKKKPATVGEHQMFPRIFTSGAPCTKPTKRFRTTGSTIAVHPLFSALRFLDFGSLRPLSQRNDVDNNQNCYDVMQNLMG